MCRNRSDNGRAVRPGKVFNANCDSSARKTMRHKAMVMVDGEFTGPSFVTHSVVAWALVVFIEVQNYRLGTTYTKVVAEMCVRMTPAPDTVMDPATCHGFWQSPKNARLLKWVQQDTVSQATGTQQINDFLHQMSARFDLRFISKPGSIDVPRLQYCLDVFCKKKPSYRIHHSSTCLLTMRTVVQTLLAAYGNGELDRLLAENRKRHGADMAPSHFPLDDCRTQIMDYICMRNVLKHEYQQRFNLMRHFNSFVAPPHVACGRPSAP